MRLYVGNLSFKANEADLESWFSEAGVAVDGVNIMRDRFSGEARGFGFAEIADEQEAARAISACNGKQMMGRALIVNEARPLSSAAARRPRPAGERRGQS
jgi:RNA recognition motif-containing protein